MKNLLCFWVCALSLLLAACSPQKKNKKDDLKVLMGDSIDANGVQRMQTSDMKNTITYKGKEYHSSVSRCPDESLAIVTDEQGARFVDNSITLQLTSGGKQVVNQTFTKQYFASLVDGNFLKHAILEGLVYDKTTPQGIVYAASICYPQTDLYIPIALTITADGKISMEKQELLEDLYDTVSVQ